MGSMFTNSQISSVNAEPPPPPNRDEINTQRNKLLAQGYSSAEASQILAAAASTPQQPQAGGSSPKPDTVSLEIKFIIVSNGNVTPTWKLVRVSANTGSTPLVNVGRTRTHDLIITIGPPTQTTANTHLALQIGQSIGAANQAILSQAPAINNAFNFPLNFPGRQHSSR